MKMPGLAIVIVAVPLLTSFAPDRNEIVAAPVLRVEGSMKFTWLVLAATIVPATPFTWTPSGTVENAPNADAKDPGASPCSEWKLAPFTVIAFPAGGAGGVPERAMTAASTGSCRAK